jgi:uncharacterized protein
MAGGETTVSARARERDHSGLEILDHDECVRRLRSQYVGRVGFIVDDRPLVLPVNYRWAEDAVHFRTARGTKLWHLGIGAPAVFEIDGWDETYHSGWSVLVEGTGELVTDDADLERLEQLRLRPWARGEHRAHWIRITGDLSGRAFG